MDSGSSVYHQIPHRVVKVQELLLQLQLGDQDVPEP